VSPGARPWARGADRAAAPPGGGAGPRGGAGRAALTVAMAWCVALVVGAVSAVNLAIPSLSGSTLHPSAQGVLWVVDGYVAVFACLLVPAGALADRVGRKGTLLAGMGVFAAGALVCAVAPDTGVLIAGRMVSGVGAAAVLPSTLALLLEGLAGARRRRAVAVWASMTGLAAVAGNVGGGTALQYGGWRTLFVALVPLALTALLLTAVSAPAPARQVRQVPAAGTVLLTAGVLALLYGVVSGPEHGWTSGPVLGGLAGSAAVLVWWALHELRSRHPLLDPRVLALPGVRAGAFGMAVLFLGMFGLFYVNGQYMQYAEGYGPLESGLRLLPMAAALLAGPRCSAALRRLMGARGTVALSLLVMAVGLAVIGTVVPHGPYLRYALGAALTALGCGAATPLFSHAVMSALPPERSGVGSGLQSLARELGSALGIAVTGSVVTAAFTARLPVGLTAHGVTPTTPAAALAAPGGQEAAERVVAAFTGAIGVAMPVLACVVAVTALALALLFPADA
jgi:MFS family permease